MQKHALLAAFADYRPRFLEQHQSDRSPETIVRERVAVERSRRTRKAVFDAVVAVPLLAHYLTNDPGRYLHQNGQ